MQTRNTHTCICSPQVLEKMASPKEWVSREGDLVEVSHVFSVHLSLFLLSLTPPSAYVQLALANFLAIPQSYVYVPEYHISRTFAVIETHLFTQVETPFTVRAKELVELYQVPTQTHVSDERARTPPTLIDLSNSHSLLLYQ